MHKLHPACLAEKDLLAECDVRHERRSGPGGQHRNKVSTAVVLIHRPTGTRAEASERRSQAENARQALFRLRVRLATTVRLPGMVPGKPVQPSELWRSRCQSGQLAINPAHEDFPALLAETLNAITAAEFDIAAAAKWLDTTASQLARFLQHEPAAWASVKTARRDRGLRPLH